MKNQLIPQTRKFLWLFAIMLMAVGKVSAQNKPEVLLRFDDIGMNHAVNTAMEDVCKTGIAVNTTVMFACPWYQEAVEILKKYPNAAVGIHLTLTSEWRYYRWGPITGPSAVPSLVDSLGYFFKNEDEFLKSNWSLADVEKELTAQIERALQSGLTISFMDPHMGISLITPELTELTQKLARKYNLGISTLGSNTYYNESYKDMWAIPVEKKKETFLKHLHNLKPDQPNLVILHIAHRDPEMEVLEMHSLLKRQNGVPMAGQHRQTELDMVLSPEFQQMVGKDFRLITYEELVKKTDKK
jgi:chitin disaccharide deacetylase